RRGGALDGKRYLSPHTVAVMTSNQVDTLFFKDGMGFGLGFETTERLGANGFSAVGTFGWSGAYGSDYEVDPEENLVIVLMIQVVPYYGSGIRESFENTVYQSLVPSHK
ncbi:MAG: serine hydrolase, partial [Balneolaceae bacterium]|nr:serine hydrolase [Balneolaceae bacterium]